MSSFARILSPNKEIGLDSWVNLFKYKINQTVNNLACGWGSPAGSLPRKETHLMNNNSQHRRQFTRVEVPLRADIRFGAITKKGLLTQNLSLKGVFLECAPGFPVGAECYLHFRLEGADPPAEMKMKGRVAWASALLLPSP